MQEGNKLNGYTGSILRVNLKTRKISTIDTKKYEMWGGGHGIGSAIFFDLVKDKAISGYDSGNVVTIMTSPLSGTLAPAVSGRTEVQGVGLQSYPVEWFTRSNFGGRFAGMLKYAGWDGIVIEGKSKNPVWIDIRDREVKLVDAKPLWGLDTWETQKKIWHRVTGLKSYKDWMEVGKSPRGERTTLKPAVLTIGPAGENLSRIASLIHDAGNAAGQGGFGGVWGSKNLKAISVIGSGSIHISDPNALMEARLWAKKSYSWQPGNLTDKLGSHAFSSNPSQGSPSTPGVKSRPSGCMACHKCCRRKTELGGNESSCVDMFFYCFEDAKKHGKQTTASLKASDLIQKTGINAFELETVIIWLKTLHKKGILGPGKEIDTDLPFDKMGEYEFVEKLVTQLETRQGIGADLHNGAARTAKKWGRFEKDLKSGVLALQYWGYPKHYDARTEVEWGYGSILGDRDCNEHDFMMPCYYSPSMNALAGMETYISAKEVSQIIAEKCKPYNDPLMIDYSDEGIYSEHMAKTVAWHRHYTRFWKQSIGYCDWCYADFVNPYAPGYRGITPEAEPKFLNAVTGKNLTFEQGMELGRKIWNLDRAIWILQGRHRDQEVFADFTYEKPQEGHATYEIPYVMTVHEKGKWKYKDVGGRILDRSKFEEWKTKYYTLEGWDPESGWPVRKTLKSMGLDYVADELHSHKKLGRG